jgi:hypothetical protein
MKAIDVRIAPAGNAEVKAPTNDPIRRLETIIESSVEESIYPRSVVLVGRPNCRRKGSITLMPPVTPVS